MTGADAPPDLGCNGPRTSLRMACFAGCLLPGAVACIERLTARR
jgi:hypothetical protein